MSDSPFLRIPPTDWVTHNALAFAVRDKYPVTPGHTLVIPKRVVPTWFEANREEQDAIMRLVAEVKAALDLELAPDGYNIGFNVGEAAGQTVMHLHVHVIPRHRGDMDDPRGGVRHVIPSKGNYLGAAGDRGPLAGGGTIDPFWRHVQGLFALADEIAIVAAFAFEGGVELIANDLKTALRRGARIRVLTGDYRNASEPGALEALLDFQSASRAGLDDESALHLAELDDITKRGGSLETRVIEVASLPGPGASFHPKSWRFESRRFGIAFVGSSNLSRTALSTGVEWNLRVHRDRDAHAYGRIRDEFESLWAMARPLDASWLRSYSQRPRPSSTAIDGAELADAPLPLESPHRVQLAALAALQASRAQGRRRALVVLATGLGKTWLAVFDYAALAIELGRRPRLLFLAHRRELLRQAAHTYRRLLHARKDPATVGWFVESENDLNADLVFASISKLSRPEHLARLETQHFDYVVVDEVHHA
ncbi:MAG: helicase-related protein, partial [Myxococcaceae bacterium]|nr:helicase-related protein [Myxococcaceae bacterium]